MDHWSSKYVGKKYVQGEYDCTHMTVEVMRREFGLNVDLPTERVPTDFGLSALIDKYKEAYTVPTSKPKDGSIVLMKARNRLNHVGVYCVIDGKPYVLHNQKNVGGVVLHKLRDLKNWNIVIDSFYELRVAE